jgi:lactate permease
MLYFIPLLVLLILLAITRKIFYSILFSFVSLLIIYPFILNFQHIFEVLPKSLLISFQIFLLVFSLLSLFYLVEEKNKKLLEEFKNKDFKTFILLGIYFTILLEGLVGFGVPGMIVVRSLSDIGFDSLISSTISLLSESYSTFGAFAIPIEVGMKGLEKSFLYLTATVFSILIIFIFISALYFFPHKKIEADVLLSLVAFSTSFYFLNLFNFYTISLSISASISILILIKNELKKLVKFFKFFYPFFIIILLYLLLKFLDIGFIKVLIQNFGIGPIAFLVLIFYLFNTKNKKFLSKSFYKSLFLFVNVFLLSFISFSIVPQISDFLSSNLSFLGKYYIFVSPLIGIFGAFIFGSATLSNLVFAELQSKIAQNLDLSLEKILTLQSLGAGLGNAISLYNILAIASLVEIEDKWIKIFKVNLFIVFIVSIFFSLIFFLT